MNILRKLLFFLFGIFPIVTVFAQQTIIKGSVKDGVSFESIAGVTITIEETNQSTQTNTDGAFIFQVNVPLGEQILRISKEGFITKRYPIIVNEFKTVDIIGYDFRRRPCRNLMICLPLCSRTMNWMMILVVSIIFQEYYNRRSTCFNERQLSSLVRHFLECVG